MLYFSYTRSASGYTKAVFQSIFPRFFVVNAQFVYEEMYLTLNSDIGSLLVRIDRVALKREWETQSFVLNLVPGTLEIAF